VRPLIGINCDVKPGQRRRGDGRLLTLTPDLPKLVAAAGGVPFMLAPLAAAGAADAATLEAIVDVLDGVIFTGGDDMDPAAYDEAPHPKLDPLDRERDVSDFVLARFALERNLPLLGICGGMQLLNVVCGGSLHQHLADRAADTFPDLLPVHRDSDANPGEHQVAIEAGTRLAAIFGVDELATNSRHHQAVHRLGQSLRVTARATDGVVEAIEAADDRPLIGVQWHPEDHAADSLHARLFTHLVEQARVRSRRPQLRSLHS
jgi:gamma-glutamyl-gamma-aminobutyrate hydrolase PuuD